MGWIIYNADGTVASSGGSGGITQLTGNVTAGPGSGSQVATIPAGTVTEAMQVLANNTTNNVSISKHGYAPILPNDNTKFLDGTGAYSTPPGSSPLTTKGDLFGFSTVNARLPVGSDTQVLTADSSQTLGIKWAASGAASGFVLLEQHTASASATLDFTSCISSSYDEYEIHFISIVPSTNGAGILMRMSTDGGATYDASAGHYSWQMWFMWNAGGSANGSTSDSSITIDNNISSGSGVSYGGRARLYNPAAATSLFTLIEGTGNVIDSSRTATDSAGTMFSGKYRVTGTAVNAFRFLMSSGNITSGTIRVYGLAK